MFIAMLMAVLVSAPAPQASSKPLDLAPGAQYDSRIPTLKQITGHDYGEAISTPEEIAAYFKALEAASAERMTLVEYGRSYEGRPLYVALDRRIRSASGPTVSRRSGRAWRRWRTRAAGPIAGRRPREERPPVVVWLLHAVHGNEISSSDAAMAEAYHLLAAQGDPKVDADPARRGRPDRSAAEPRRPRALHRVEPAGERAAAEQRARLDRARRAVARRPVEPLPVRHEPRLARAVAARDARARVRFGLAVPPAGRRRTCTRWAATPRTTSRRRPIPPTRTSRRASRTWLRHDSAAPTRGASTRAASRTSSARSSTRSIRATATRGRCSTAPSA